MNKHTPGPWSAPSAGIYAGPIVDGYATGPMIATLGGREVTKQMKKHGRDLREAVANARLMAAAPCLLVSLERVLAWIDAGCDPSDRSIADARRAVQSARS